MKHTLLRLIALVLCALLLTGCGGDLHAFGQALDNAMSSDIITTFDEMTYTRPDMDTHDRVLSAAIDAAAGEDAGQIVNMVWSYYDVYDDFFTNYSLADLHYCHDLTDTYWAEEYNYCAQYSTQVETGLDSLYRALAVSPCLEELESEKYFGPGFFDSYQGESMFDETFTALMDREAQLQSRYYELAGIAGDYDSGTEEFYDACGNDMLNLLVELIALRQEMALYWGYDSYPQFATDLYHYRDYTIAQSEKYLDEIQQELVPLYVKLAATDIWSGFLPTTEEETYGYVREMARNMDGTVKEAFDLLDQGGLYDISWSENKYPTSFEVYLTTYWEPFIYMCPGGSTYDHLTFAHEFGHFCNDFASYGSYAGVDVLEFFSQGMEYLSLCYVSDTKGLTEMKMADSLSIYVEQAAFASFELEMYALTGEELTAENLIALYDRVAQDYGFESVGYDPREFVTISHYFTNPMYIMSYVVSNDAALQLYQLEMAVPGDGLAVFEENLATGEVYFLSFLEYAGLESPFAPGRIQRVRRTFEEILGNA